MATRFFKRRCVSAQGNTSSYHDALPVFEDYNIIHASEGEIRHRSSRVSCVLSRVERSPQRAAGVWEDIESWAPPDDFEYALVDNGDLYDTTLESEVVEITEATMAALPPPTQTSISKKARSLVSKRPHVVWKETHRQSYLKELIHWSGRGDFRNVQQCLDCVGRNVECPGDAKYRCRECFVPDLTCEACCIRRHRLHPFHRLEEWTGTHFVDVWLKDLGYRLQLNHTGSSCDNPIRCHSRMLMLHTNGIHSLDIYYCGCARAIPNHLQLLRRRLYPATQISIKTCASFELLRFLHKLALTSKGSTYDFYRCLEKLTTNIGIEVPKTRYRALYRIILQWRHLQMLKWAGRGNDPTGVAGTSPGELAVKCPSCPYPGINIPDNWREVPEKLRFLYAMIICVDANFRLKNQLVSNYSQDPGLGPGLAYMIPREKYGEYVKSRASDSDISTCVGFQALAKANTKFSIGLCYTGVGMATCGRSEMILPLAVGNLQKGERYANMDYIVGMVLQAIAVACVLVSYDIACQWFINLFKRIHEHWPQEIKPPDGLKIDPAIPKMHEPAHEQSNHEIYSLNYIPGVGQSDCECPERCWAEHNPLSNATKTQGPGSRQDTLDDHFGFWNWLKYISMGTTLSRRYKNAVADRNLQSEAHRSLTDTLPDDLKENWEKMCLEWEAALFPKKDVKNPYHTEGTVMTKAQVKKNLAEIEAKFLASGGSFPHAMTASKFISLGLELEEAQRRVARLAKGVSDHSTLRQSGTLTEQRNLLSGRIRAWELLLPVYLPGIVQYHTDHPIEVASTNAEDMPLWLPSAIPAQYRCRITTPALTKIEQDLRYAQLADSLAAIRQILKVKSRMIAFKNKNIRGQRGGTRSTTIIDRVHEKAKFSAAKYRKARNAYMELAGGGKWEDTYQVLEDKDIRGYQDPNKLRKRVGRKGTQEDDHQEEDEEEVEDELDLRNDVRTRRDGTGETRRTLSWIWLVGTAATSEEEKDDILRVKWAKSRARSMRATEEVQMLKEEMRRTLAFLEWKADWWRKRKSAWPEARSDLVEAISGFALSQADIQLSLEAHFRTLWGTCLFDSTQENTSVSDDEDDDDDLMEDDSTGEAVEPSQDLSDPVD